MNNQYKRILAALDGGSTQRLVLERAIKLSEENGASLMLVHVVGCLPSEKSAGCIDAICAGAKERLEKDLSDLLTEARERRDIPSCELKVYLGRVTGTLLDEVIIDFDPDLVICGDRGYSDFRYAFLGSVSAGLVRHAECDVLVVKNQRKR